MKKTLLGCALVLVAASANAKDKLIPLSAEDAAGLQGKTIALTTHERPSFSAMTAGKAGFGLFGAGAMIATGNKLIDENDVQDPVEIVRANLAAGLQEAYAAQVLPVDATVTAAKKPKDIAATHPEADYVLDVRSGGWMYAYFPAQWGTYWVGYSVQVQLVDAKTGRQVSNAACNANTQQHPHPPSREQLHADGAKLLKDVTASLGWTCVHLLAKEQFQFAADQIAATPVEYTDPLAALLSTPTDLVSAPQSASAPEAVVSDAQPGANAGAAAPVAETAPGDGL